MTALFDRLKVGDHLQIPKDHYGRPVFEFDREKREYIEGKLQWFEITAINESGVTLKPVWK